MNTWANVLQLGIKELRSLGRDYALLVLILYSFTLNVYSNARGLPETLHHAPIAVVDEDRSQLSTRILGALQPPYFNPPALIDATAMDAGMDAGRYTFALDIPPHFQRDLLAGRQPQIQLNVDATQIGQAFSGAGYVQEIVSSEIAEFLQGTRGVTPQAVEQAVRVLFNPNLTESWFGAVMAVITQITMLSIILTGAALIREREHGTIEHLLVMPVTPFEIMFAKVWSMALVVLLATALSMLLVVRAWLGVPIGGSLTLFLAGTGLYLFATTALGIFFGTVARSMPQLGLLTILVLMPLQILSGTTTPTESMPEFIQYLMKLAPTTHFVSFAQAILYRGAGFSVVWPQFLALLAIGAALFGYSLARFRKALAQMG